MKIFGWHLTRSSVTPGPGDDFWYQPLSAQSATGISITPDMAMRSTAVLACVRVLSETLAGLPFLLYRKDGEGRTRANDHPLYKLLHDEPNPWQTSFEFREMMMGHLLLRGNAYARKVWDSAGQVSQLVPLNPLRVTPKLQPSGTVEYEFKPQMGGTFYIPQSEIFHVRAFSQDGVTGLSPISLARESVALAIAAEEFEARCFSNNATPGGILEHPGKITDAAAQRIKRSWEEAHAGAANANKVALLEDGMKFTRIGMSSEDIQFIESRKFQLEEIARIFRVPPHLIGHLERATFSNIEHQSLEFVQHTMLPWLRRWEQAICQRLFSEADKENYYVEFLVDGLLRGDISSRYTAYSIGRQWGWLSANDVRKLENQDPLPDDQGDEYLVPMNMIGADEKAEELKQVDPPQPPKQESIPAKEPDDSKRKAACYDAFRPVVESAFKRYIERVVKNKRPKSEHVRVIDEGLTPIVRGLFVLQNERDPILQTQITLRAFFESWLKEDLRDEATEIDSCVSKLMNLVGRVAEIHVIAAPKPEEKAQVFNFTLQPPPTEAKELIVSWENDKDGKRQARIKQIGAAHEATK